MRTESDGFRAATPHVVMKYMEIVMAIIYTVVGALILWRSDFFNIPTQYSLPLGSMLMVYGLFRTYRVYTKYFKKG